MENLLKPSVVLSACRTFFGDDQATVGWLHGIKTDDLSATFRKRAFSLHPDRAGAIGRSRAALEQEFKRLHGAFRVLMRAVTLGVAGSEKEPSRPPPRPAHTRSTETPGTGRFHSGRIPDGELRLAQFLYYSRIIDWRTMIDAITWQYRVRPKVGEIGRAYRFMDAPAVFRVLRASPRSERFGDTALRLGILSGHQLNVVLGKQLQLNYPIGRFFVENGLLNRARVESLVDQNRRHNVRARHT